MREKILLFCTSIYYQRASENEMHPQDEGYYFTFTPITTDEQYNGELRLFFTDRDAFKVGEKYTAQDVLG